MANIYALELKLESQTSMALNALIKSYLSSLDSILIIVSLKWSKVFLKMIHVTQQYWWHGGVVEDNDVDCVAYGDVLFEIIFVEVIIAIIFGGNHS